MPDIVVTTPKSQMLNASEEAKECIRLGGGFYFRRLTRRPNLEIGDKVFYVEDGYVRGFAEIYNSLQADEATCSTTGKIWPPGFYIQMQAETWHWIKPIALKGFQGYRYRNFDYEIIGKWLDPKPEVENA